MAPDPNTAPTLRELGAWLSPSPRRTEQLAERIGALAHAGLVVALDGELGAGKTCFVRGFARGLGSTDPVASPTYALQHVYAGRHELWHFDAWRAGPGAALLTELGPAELGRGAVVVVEWAARVRELLPVPRLEIELLHAGEDARRLEFRWRCGAAEPTADERRLCDALIRWLREPPDDSRVGTGSATGTPPDEPPRR